MAARRVGNPGGSKLQLVNPETLAPQQKPVICLNPSSRYSEAVKQTPRNDRGLTFLSRPGL